MLDRRPARRAFVTFALASSLVSAELCWWMVLNVRGAEAQRNDRLALLERDAALATRLFGLLDPPHSAQATTWLGDHFPKLMWQCPPDGQGCVAAPRPEAIEALNAKFHRRQRMFAAEGMFLFAMLCVAFWVMQRAMRREFFMLRQQGNFLAAVTHELKSPLASIRLAVETLKRRPPTEAVLARYLQTLWLEAQRLESLVNNVLMASRLSAPHPKFKAPPSAPLDTCGELVALVAQVPDPAHRLVLKVPDAPLWVAIDAHDWRTIARNLIDNALKYADSGPVIVELVGRSCEVVLGVTDCGPGLSPEAQKRVFDKFFRVGDELSRSHDGSGLGLFLVRALSRAAGGDVGVTSQGANQGARFDVVLPRHLLGP